MQSKMSTEPYRIFDLTKNIQKLPHVDIFESGRKEVDPASPDECVYTRQWRSAMVAPFVRSSS